MKQIDGYKSIMCGLVAFLLFGASSLFSNVDALANPEAAAICSDSGKAVMALGLLALKSAIKKVSSTQDES